MLAAEGDTAPPAVALHLSPGGALRLPLLPSPPLSPLLVSLAPAGVLARRFFSRVVVPAWLRAATGAKARCAACALAQPLLRKSAAPAHVKHAQPINMHSSSSQCSPERGCSDGRCCTASPSSHPRQCIAVLRGLPPAERQWLCRTPLRGTLNAHAACAEEIDRPGCTRLVPGGHDHGRALPGAHRGGPGRCRPRRRVGRAHGRGRAVARVAAAFGAAFACAAAAALCRRPARGAGLVSPPEASDLVLDEPHGSAVPPVAQCASHAQAVSCRCAAHAVDWLLSSHARWYSIAVRSRRWLRRPNPPPRLPGALRRRQPPPRVVHPRRSPSRSCLVLRGLATTRSCER